MSTPDSISPTTDEPASIEPWLWPVLGAGLLGGLADCLGAGILYNVYLRVYAAMHPPLFRTRAIPPLTSFFALRVFALGVFWAALFALAYATQQQLRHRLRSVADSALATVIFGTVMWLVMRTLVSRGNLEEPALSVIGWLTYVLFSAPAIVTTVRRTAPTLKTEGRPIRG